MRIDNNTDNRRFLIASSKKTDQNFFTIWYSSMSPNLFTHEQIFQHLNNKLIELSVKHNYDFGKGDFLYDRSQFDYYLGEVSIKDFEKLPKNATQDELFKHLSGSVQQVRFTDHTPDGGATFNLKEPQARQHLEMRLDTVTTDLKEFFDLYRGKSASLPNTNLLTDLFEEMYQPTKMISTYTDAKNKTKDELNDLRDNFELDVYAPVEEAKRFGLDTASREKAIQLIDDLHLFKQDVLRNPDYSNLNVEWTDGTCWMTYDRKPTKDEIQEREIIFNNEVIRKKESIQWTQTQIDRYESFDNALKNAITGNDLAKELDEHLEQKTTNTRKRTI